MAAMDALAQVLAGSGDHAGAAQQHEELLLHRQRTLGEEHPATLASMHALGATLQVRHAALEASCGMPRAPLRCTVMVTGFLGFCPILGFPVLPQAAGEHTAAARQYARALRLRRAALGAEHPDTLRSMHSLGLALDCAGDHALAARRLEKALNLQLKVCLLQTTT